MISQEEAIAELKEMKEDIIKARKIISDGQLAGALPAPWSLPKNLTQDHLILLAETIRISTAKHKVGEKNWEEL
jgi:hypothetical protein